MSRYSGWVGGKEGRSDDDVLGIGGGDDGDGEAVVVVVVVVDGVGCCWGVDIGGGCCGGMSRKNRAGIGLVINARAIAT